MNYREEIIKAMKMLGEDPRTIFLGQNVVYSGATTVHETLQDVPKSKKIEMPVAEDLQMGMSIGLALQGYVPVSVYPRMDFLILAMNQLVNHLDKIEEMSAGRFRPKVIIRTCIGAKEPLNPGPQHCQDHALGLDWLLKSIRVVKLLRPEQIVPDYQAALLSHGSTILIEQAREMK